MKRNRQTKKGTLTKAIKITLVYAKKYDVKLAHVKEERFKS